jgi:hypothetical protein
MHTFALVTLGATPGIVWRYRMVFISALLSSIVWGARVFAPERVDKYLDERKIRKAKSSYRGSHAANSRAVKRECRRKLKAFKAKQDAKFETYARGAVTA